MRISSLLDRLRAGGIADNFRSQGTAHIDHTEIGQHEASGEAQERNTLVKGGTGSEAAAGTLLIIFAVLLGLTSVYMSL